QPVLPPGYPGGGKKKKSRTGLIIGIVVLVFLLLAGAGAAGYFLILRPGLEAGAAAEKETKEDAETAEGETLAEEAPGAESEGDGGQETQATLAEEETGDAASQGAAESTQADGGAGTFSSQGALSDSELARTIASYNTRGNSAVSIDVFEENFTPGTRNTSLAWDKTLFYTMEDIDPNSPADGLINGLDITRKMLTNAATGNQMEYEIYTNPSTGKVNKIVSIEYMEGYLEITDYYYDDNGRVSFIFIRNDINYIPSYAIPTKDGQRFYFNSDCMVKWRVVSNGVQANYVIGPESARQGGNASSSIFQYSTLEAGAKANYDQTEKRMINAAYNTYQKVLAARGVSEITGYVYDESGAPALNAQVVLVDDAANEKLYESKTDASGRYRVMVPSEDGVYRLVVSREDCVDATVYGIEISNQILADYQDAVYMVEKSDASYPVSVHMYDALNYAQDGNGMERLSNAAVYIRDGVNHKTGGVVAQATANVEGVVDVALPPGMYTAEVMKEGYDSTYYNFAARENMEAVQINASPRLAEGEVRIVLTWGSTPSDLDSHLFTPYDNTFGDSTYHIWYGNQRDAVGNNLDVDDTTSYGPETMTIPVLKNGLYKYYVADFTHCAGGDPTSFEMSNSGAMVNVYTSNGLTATFTVPANTSGVIWEVFELRNGSIVPIQRYYSNIDDKSWWHNDK
ncbi:MAG: carboxypeptidase regulatory-like domain-containing protein, partial [Lachnospiraceae bacterium]|nr:carboxypeptidase regulatory-like domain-containing protein [Lachnospiraceae bacterium]